MKKIILSIALLTKTNFYLHSSSLELSPQEKKSVSSVNPFDFQNFDSLQPINNQGMHIPEEFVKDESSIDFFKSYFERSPKALKAWKTLCTKYGTKNSSSAQI